MPDQSRLYAEFLLSALRGVWQGGEQLQASRQMANGFLMGAPPQGIFPATWRYGTARPASRHVQNGPSFRCQFVCPWAVARFQPYPNLPMPVHTTAERLRS